ncbi:hypothetical protein TSAR_006739 [Trichomalopsis sarcophagae]|uniref:PDZ domain-containing protein n=1 Tax=Trichomalopsis sarcophagae TaxID=543379 RepID=A0A232F1G4_9HYME|nr:hypothetical protein TSAR_006739 [Trichomalopsis sarcophagae]
MNGSQQQEAEEATGSASQSAAQQQQQPGSSGNSRNSGGIELSDDEEWSSLVERSYGIHYKREQEIEMVTYVDYVEYDGPAFKAGMREGDVILSINGQEMDRADHKTLVNFIKNCDARMRMVVSFEDCVRKVELHMRYIELQRALQSRLSELERLCERERSILMGRWKTHSLPARKRTPSSQAVSGESSLEPTSSSTLNSSATQSCCRPASSTEHLLLYSVYADGRSFLIPRSAACLVAIGPPRSRSDHHHFLSNVSVESAATATSTTSSSRHSYHQANGVSNTNTPSKSKDRSTHSSKTNLQAQEQRQPERQSTSENQNLHPSARNLCVACISSASRRSRNDQAPQGDGGSLDAYDLASPCCDPNCVPSRRRREKQRRAKHEQGSQTHQHQVWQQQQQQQQQSQQQAVQTQTTSREQRDAQAQTQPREHHSSQHNCSRASGHSLHSITSSEMSTGAADSVVSCSTSLSTDTLYWDPNVQHRPPPCLQYAKPKSWDNLTTKAFGGYGFGYGYLDTAKSTHSAERPAKSGSSSLHHGRAKTPTNSSSSCSQSRRTSGTQVYSSNSGSGRHHFQPTKSTESLLIATPYPTELDATLSCECLDGPNPRFIAVQLEKHKRQNDTSSSYATRAEAQQQVRHRRSSHSDAKQRSSINASEITRL